MPISQRCNNKVFIYGSLKKGGCERGLQESKQCKLLGTAITTQSNFDLFDLGKFPTITLNGKYKIQGEMWSVTKDKLRELDKIEGYPSFYTKTMVETNLGEAETYLLTDKSWDSCNVNKETLKVQEKDRGIVQWLVL